MPVRAGNLSACLGSNGEARQRRLWSTWRAMTRLGLRRTLKFMSTAPSNFCMAPRGLRLLALGALLSALSACVTAPPVAPGPPAPDAVATQAPQPPPNPQIFVYPNNAQ